MTTADQRTLEVYDKRAADYAAKFDSPNLSPWVKALIDTLAPGAHVLDFGCGMGRVSAQMIAAGLKVDAVDASIGMAAEAKRLHDVEVRIADFQDLNTTDAYDAALAQFSLLHAPRSDLPDLLGRLHRSIKPGGRFVIGMKLGTGDRRDKIGRFYTYVTEPELTMLLTNAGFTPMDTLRGEDAGFDGSVDPWIVVTSRA